MAQFSIMMILGMFISGLSLAMAVLVGSVFTNPVANLLRAVFIGMIFFGLLISYDAIIKGRKNPRDDD